MCREQGQGWGWTELCLVGVKSVRGSEARSEVSSEGQETRDRDPGSLGSQPETRAPRPGQRATFQFIDKLALMYTLLLCTVHTLSSRY